MVGFLGTQHRLSGTLDADQHSTTVLKNGTVITAYIVGTGPISIYSFNPKTKVTTALDTVGTIGNGDAPPHVVATADGGFNLVYNHISRSGSLTPEDTPNLISQKYDASGNAVGSEKVLATGWIDGTNAFETGNGILVTYRDRDAGADPQYVGAFYGKSGALLNTFDFGQNAQAGGFPHPAPKATVLGNGNLAVIWQKTNLDGSFLQIFRPNGTTVGSEKALGDIPATQVPEVIATNPKGGFVIAHNVINVVPGGLPESNTISLQKYSNTGNKLGKPIIFDTEFEGYGKILSSTDFDVGFTKSGLITIVWTGLGVAGNRDSDIFYAVLSPTGKLVIGPQVADETTNSGQQDVEIDLLNNGDQMLTFLDNATVQFSHVASIEGRFIQEPDFYWEGSAKANVKNGTSGDDIMLGLGGNDTIKTGKGEDYVKGGKGNDKIYGEARKDVLLGEDGIDLIYGGSGDDSLYGGNGNDKLYGGANNDALFGEAGFDTLIGGLGADTLYGGLGNDKLVAGSKSSTLYGGEGRDILLGRQGADKIYGEAGNDRITGRLGNDVLDGAEGDDKLFGGDGFDVLRGGDGKDRLYGGKDDDAFYSGDGNDLEFGGAGNDRFYDSKGNDRMRGGAGADTFIFATTDFGKDVITDFEFGTDKLDMRTTATSLDATSQTISIVEVANGVRFVVDSNNWVLVKGATLSDFQPDDYDITPWI